MCAPFLPDDGGPIALAGDDTAAATRLPFPIALPPGVGRFVGRADELTALRTPWTRAADAAQRRLVLVGGDPGIGKSRLTAEFARDVYDNGATVLFGRCYEENVVPYQPFVEAVEQYLKHGDPAEVRADLVRSGTLLARLVPDIGLRFPDLPEPIRAEPDTERYLMFEAVDALLGGIAKRAPLLLVLDDLHWADRPTLALLGHVARQSDAAPLLLLGTYRTSEVVGEHPLRGIIADLRHDGVAEDIALGGLSEGEVADLIDSTSDLDPRPGFVHSVRRATAGNPFFVQEICSHVGETGATAGAFTLEALGVPEGVKEVIARRIARLPEGTERLLTMGALIGREFELDLLVDVAVDDEDAVLDALERACTARLVEEVAGPIGRYSFVHALTREALYDSLGATRRARLHRRVAEAIESRYVDDLEDYFGALAFHYAAAGTDVPKAVEYAASPAIRLSPVSRTRTRPGSSSEASISSPSRTGRCDLLLGLAEARHRGGDVLGSHAASAEAAALARAFGDAERLARAAVGSFRGHVMASPGWHDPVIALLEDALELLPVEDSGLRSRVLAALSLELYFTPQQLRGLTSAQKPSPWRGGSATTTLAFAPPMRTRHFTTPGTSMPASPCRPSSSPSAKRRQPELRTSVTCIAL